MEVKIKQKVQRDEKPSLINRTGYSFVSWEERRDNLQMPIWVKATSKWLLNVRRI